MRFENQPSSSNIEDRRGARVSMGRGGLPFGGMRLPMGRGGMGLGGLLLLLALAYFSGLTPFGGGSASAGGGAGGGASGAWSQDSEGPVRETEAEGQMRLFVGQVLATTEDCWRTLFQEKLGRVYDEPKLVLFRDAVRSACGEQSSSVGPFYCPGDMRLFLDLSFFDELDRSLGAKGDFARAYVIAHEVGHHVQNLLGTNRRVAAVRGGEAERNRASVMLELQADYYAGVWAHFVDKRLRDRVQLDVGDYEEAIRAAQAVGDDVLQRRATGRVVPEKFTHGTAAQRAKWFRLGFESGDPTAHDPFVEEK
jgi:predicted metalloprotease